MAPFASATLVLDGPSGPVQAEITSGRVSLGRTPDNDVVVSDAAASGRHCELVVEEGRLELHDLGSSNGTLVNGQRVESAVLHDGDVIRIGQTQGRIRVLGTDGKPLRPRVSRMPLVAVAIVVLAALSGVGTYFFISARQREQEHERFAEYARKAAELLGRSPCQLVSRIQLDYLQKHEGDAALVVAPSGGELAPADRQTDEDLLAGARKRSAQVAEISAHLSEQISTQKASADELVKVKETLSDPALSRAVEAIDNLFGQQRQIARDFQNDWLQYAASVRQLETNLSTLLKAEPKVARLEPVPPPALTPNRIVEKCEASFRETRTKGLAQLNALAP